MGTAVRTERIAETSLRLKASMVGFFFAHDRDENAQECDAPAGFSHSSGANPCLAAIRELWTRAARVAVAAVDCCDVTQINRVLEFHSGQ